MRKKLQLENCVLAKGRLIFQISSCLESSRDPGQSALSCGSVLWSRCPGRRLYSVGGEETEIWLTTDVAKISISSRKRRAHRHQPTSLPPGTMFPTDEKHVPGNDCNFSGGQLSTTCRREKPTIVEQHSSSTVDRSLVRDHS